jgi:hypothetical protein
MSALGHKRTFCDAIAHVRFTPERGQSVAQVAGHFVRMMWSKPLSSGPPAYRSDQFQDAGRSSSRFFEPSRVSRAAAWLVTSSSSRTC